MIAFSSADRPEDPFFAPNPVVVTDRLVLRLPCHDDLPDIVTLAGNLRVAQMLRNMPHPYSESDARDFLSQASDGKSGAIYALTLCDSGTFVGCASLEVDTICGISLGYWLGEPYWGFGYASEAAGALVDLAFRSSNLDKLVSCCRITNTGSRRVLLKCGFQPCGTSVAGFASVGLVTIEHFKLDRQNWLDRHGLANAS